MKAYGLLGEKLGHSRSPEIHSLLGSVPYSLFEVAPGDVEAFLRSTTLAGMNVTIPYKKAVLPFCTRLSDVASETGSVNTLVRESGGWHGYNTDYDGFVYAVRRSGVRIAGKDALIFGSGGVSGTVRLALHDLGAKSVTVISRSGENNYENLDRHAHAQILVNCTPVGMYPETGKAVVSLSRFSDCEAVFDLIYNPLRTALLLDARSRGIPAFDGLPMLTAQAARAAELFTGRGVSEESIEAIEKKIRKSMQNIVLIGMPGSGKTTVGSLLAERLGRRFVDLDAELAQSAGMDIEAIFRDEGEAGFRARETAEIAKWGKETGLVLATGGGCVTRAENEPLLRQNGVLIWLRRDLASLPTDGRPLSQTNDLRAMYDARRPLYEAFSDHSVDNRGTAEEAAERILEVLR